MDGLLFVQLVEAEIKKHGISKEQFYKECGISSATMSQWRKRIYTPSSTAIKKIEDYFGVTFTIKQAENGNRTVDDDDIKFALFGGSEEITDDMYEEVKSFAEFVKNREEQKKHK